MRRALLVMLAGCTVLTSSQPQAIIGGAPSNEPAVVALLRRSVSCHPEAAPVECTGTLVAPRVVVTAAHCVGDGPVNALEVFFGNDVAGAGTTIAVVGGRAHADYDPATHANDVAALILAADAPVAPIAIAAPSLVDVQLVGYGITTGTGTDVGIQRVGTARVTEVNAMDLRVVPGPAMSCRGDSGGPVLSGGALVGITSYGDPACTQFGVAMRADAYETLIRSVTNEVGTARSTFDPDAAFCSTTCTADPDCPEETVCVHGRCSYRGLPAAEFGGTCAGEGECACIAMPDGRCRELLPCEGESTCRATDPGCGCGSSGRGSLALVVLALLTVRRSARTATR